MLLPRPRALLLRPALPRGNPPSRRITAKDTTSPPRQKALNNVIGLRTRLNRAFENAHGASVRWAFSFAAAVRTLAIKRQRPQHPWGNPLARFGSRPAQL